MVSEDFHILWLLISQRSLFHKELQQVEASHEVEQFKKSFKKENSKQNFLHCEKRFDSYLIFDHYIASSFQP